MKLLLPQELLDKIFLYLDYDTLVNCREIQSEFVKSTTHYNCCKDAAINGNLKALKWLKEQGCPWNENTFGVAVKNGNIDTLVWLKENGCPWNSWTFVSAAEHGDLKVLEWLKENGCPWDRYTFVIAALCRNLEILNWLKEQGCPGHEDAILFYT
jgi:hypothetical protein